MPFLFKLAIDWLAALGGAEASLASFTDANATMLALFASPAAVLIGYGIARSGVSACTGTFVTEVAYHCFLTPEKLSKETPLVSMRICIFEILSYCSPVKRYITMI